MKMACPKCGSREFAANGISESGIQRYRCSSCARRFTDNTAEFVHEKAEFEVEDLPDELATAEELLERRKKEFARIKAANDARSLIRVKMRTEGPIGILHFGDPHVDDPGTDIHALERHTQLILDTPGLFGGNVGDNHNNWVGRLGRLYGEQSTSEAEAWRLVEWFVNRVEWLYLIGGNHDCWSGAGDPLKWISRAQPGVKQDWGARIALEFSNGRQIRVNARHDFKGHSQWNPVHGAAKAVQMGWRDHVLTCGHKHVSGYNVLKCPATGLISHAIRVAGYKVYDRYAIELGLPNQNISPACLTIIDPDRADNDPAQVQVFWDAELGADVLKFMRKKAA